MSWLVHNSSTVRLSPHALLAARSESARWSKPQVHRELLLCVFFGFTSSNRVFSNLSLYDAFLLLGVSLLLLEHLVELAQPFVVDAEPHL